MLVYSEVVRAGQVTLSCFPSPVLDQDNACIFPYTYYRVILRALRASGLDGSQQSYDITTMEDIPSDAPTVNSSSTTSSSATLSVFAPPYSNGAIQKFRASYYAMDTPSIIHHLDVNTTMVAGQIQYTLTGLHPYRTYGITVAVATSAGYSNFTNEYQFQTDEAVPSRPVPPQLTYDLSMEHYVASWSAPSPLPGVILYYELIDVSNSHPVTIYVGNNTQFALPSSVTAVQIRTATRVGVSEFSNAAVLNSGSIGGVPKSSSSSSASTATVAGVAVAIGVAVLALVVIPLVYFRRKSAKCNKDQIMELAKKTIAPEVQQALDRMAGGNPKVPRDIDEKHLQLIEPLGEGKFGCVFKAKLDEHELNGVPGYIVAAKASKAEASDKEKTELLMEAVVMAQFSHGNIVNLIGHCISEVGLVMVVVEFCEHGSLSSFMDKNDRQVVDGLATKFGHDVARGMDFIANLGFVHRDLAVRGGESSTLALALS